MTKRNGMPREDVRTLGLHIISENYLRHEFWSTNVRLTHDTPPWCVGGRGEGHYAHRKLYCIALHVITLIPPLTSSTRFTPHHYAPIQRVNPRMKQHFISDALYKYKQFQNDWYVWIPKAKYREFEARYLATPHFPYNTIRNR